MMPCWEVGLHPSPPPPPRRNLVCEHCWCNTTAHCIMQLPEEVLVLGEEAQGTDPRVFEHLKVLDTQPARSEQRKWQAALSGTGCLAALPKDFSLLRATSLGWAQDGTGWVKSLYLVTGLVLCCTRKSWRMQEDLLCASHVNWEKHALQEEKFRKHWSNNPG